MLVPAKENNVKGLFMQRVHQLMGILSLYPKLKMKLENLFHHMRLLSMLMSYMLIYFLKHMELKQLA